MTAILDSRAAWLERRRSLVTASDVPAILGVDERRGPLAVYAEKVGAVEVEETRWMRWGRRLEGAIADGYAEETGREVLDLGATSIQIHPDISWLGATLDRVTRGSKEHPAPAPESSDGLAAGIEPHAAPLECKAVAGHKAEEWRDDPPLAFQVQLQIQIACNGASWGSLVALIGGMSLAWKDLVRNEKFLTAALPRLEEFLLRVKRREPPEADGLPGTTAAIKRLWGGQGDGSTVTLDQEALSIVEAWEKAKLDHGKAESRVKELGNKLRARIGAASFGALVDGSFLSLKKVENKGYVVDPFDYRALRRFWPRIKRR